MATIVNDQIQLLDDERAFGLILGQLGFKQVSTFDEETNPKLQPNINFQVWPRGLTTELEQLPSRSQQVSITRLPPNFDSIFGGIHQWEIFQTENSIVDEKEYLDKLTAGNSMSAQNLTTSQLIESSSLSQSNFQKSLSLLDLIENRQLQSDSAIRYDFTPFQNLNESSTILLNNPSHIHSIFEEELVGNWTQQRNDSSSSRVDSSETQSSLDLVSPTSLWTQTQIPSSFSNTPSRIKPSPPSDLSSLLQELERDTTEGAALLPSLEPLPTTIPIPTPTSTPTPLPSDIPIPSESFPPLPPPPYSSSSLDDPLLSAEALLSPLPSALVPSSPTSLPPPSLSWADPTPLDEGEFDLIRPRLALQFPFELDHFQKQAVLRLERRECVFVAAHTSAGKTVVAEYAIALAMKHASRAVYTSPIKALSNQKFRDLSEKFGQGLPGSPSGSAGGVGLLTGDVSVNPEAPCLIMTTEILRSMLYRGADTIRDIEWVIFDEVHYVNDAERGVVWEEVIIMLPDRINLIFLSATTPNTLEFCDWIGRTKRRKVYVTSTLKRPVPLQHFLFHDSEAYKVLQGEGPYSGTAALAEVARRQKEKLKPKEKSQENQRMALERSQEKLAIAAQNAGKSVAKFAASSGGKGGGGGGGGAGKPSGGAVVRRISNHGSKAQWVELLNVLQVGGREASGGVGAVDFGVGFSGNMMSRTAREQRADFVPYDKLPDFLKEKMTRREYEKQEVRGSEEEAQGDGHGLLPVVIFSFSKKKCEEIADFLKGENLLTGRERGEVQLLMASLKRRLSPLDASLPQVERMEEMLCRGVGVHHGGLLPILKEAVELLFSRSIVKVLMATETFAMGVNMPAKSVVFNGYRKHDGKGFRDLHPGEYTQMAGRAGRRGLDKVGTVVIAAWGDPPQETSLKTLLTGTAMKLSSRFKLRYSMILNLLRASDLSVSDMIRRSFSEFHSQRALSTNDLQTKLKTAERMQSQLSFICREEGLNGLYLLNNGSAIKLDEPLNEGEKSLRTCVEESESAAPLQRDQLSCLLSVNKQSLSASFTPGRFLLVQHPSLPCPCLAAVLTLGLDSTTPSSPSTTSSLADLRKSSATTPPPSPSSQSTSLADVNFFACLLLPPTCPDPTLVLSSPLSAGSSKGRPGIGLGRVNTAHPPPTTWSERTGSFSFSSSTLSVSDTPNEREGGDNDVNQWRGWEEGPEGGGGGGGGGEGGVSRFAVLKMTLSQVLLVLNKKVKFEPKPPTSPSPSSPPSLPSSLLSPLLSSLHSYFSEPFPTPCVCDVMREGRVQLALEAGDRQARLGESGKTLHLVSRYLYSTPSSLRSFKTLLLDYKLTQKVSFLRHLLSNEALSLFPQVRQRLSVLESLGYVEAGEGEGLMGESATGLFGSVSVSLKGRVACEMNTCDELLATEMILNNLLEPLNPPEAAALLSALVFQEKNSEDGSLTSRLEAAREKMKEMAANLQSLQEREGVPMSSSDPDSKPALNFGLCAVVYEWARGKPFRDITQMTLTHEGTIVRTITRLDELIKDIRNAARVIGNPSLYRKMEAASQCIKRDIVFAASLYIS